MVDFTVRILVVFCPLVVVRPRTDGHFSMGRGCQCSTHLSYWSESRTGIWLSRLWTVDPGEFVGLAVGGSYCSDWLFLSK